MLGCHTFSIPGKRDKCILYVAAFFTATKKHPQLKTKYMTGNASHGTGNMLSLHFHIFHMSVYIWTSKAAYHSAPARNIALSGFSIYLCTCGQVKQRITTHLPQEHCTHPHTCCLCTFRYFIFVYIWTSQKAYHNSQLTFFRNFALVLTHVQVCQIPLTWPTNELPDRWPETGIHQGMNAIVDWVNNERNCCIATQRLQSANVITSDNKRNQMLSSS